MLFSPIVDMERLILDMMKWANISEDELMEKKEIETFFGDLLSWEYLTYIRNNPINWDIPTNILFVYKDNTTSVNTMIMLIK